MIDYNKRWHIPLLSQGQLESGRYWRADFPDPQKMMLCPHCGAEGPGSRAVCNRCGLGCGDFCQRASCPKDNEHCPCCTPCLDNPS